VNASDSLLTEARAEKAQTETILRAEIESLKEQLKRQDKFVLRAQEDALQKNDQDVIDSLKVEIKRLAGEKIGQEEALAKMEKEEAHLTQRLSDMH
jgi:hypothetical protein